MNDASTSALRQLTDRANEQHSENAAAARELLVSAPPLASADPGDVEHYLRTAQHVLLGHLDDAPALSALLARVPAGTADVAVTRAGLALQLVEGLQALHDDTHLPPAAQVAALADAALALTRRHDWLGLTARLEAAAALAARHPDDAATQRGFAVMANNIAGHMRYDLLLEHRADAPRVQAMLDAAHRAREAWARAGGWMQVDRAEYQLALCHAAAGLGEPAVAHARACLSLCEANGADAYERLFAHEALARAHHSAAQAAEARMHRDRMAALVAEVDDASSREFAQGALRQLDADLAASR